MRYIQYSYRDANNYKQHASIAVTKEPTKRQLQELRNACEEGEYFIPQQVGIRPLQDAWDKPDPDADHAWHELGDGFGKIEVTRWAIDPICGPIHPRVLVARFQQAAREGWDIMLWEGNWEEE